MTAAVSLRSTRSRHDPKLIAKLAEAARAIRALSIAAIYRAGSGHPGSALAIADVLAALYGAEMNLWPGRLDDPDRDRCVLSRRAVAPAFHAAAAHFGFCTAGEALLGHPHTPDLPWMDTGKASVGLSIALGMAEDLRLKKSPARVYGVFGGDELHDRNFWEAARDAARHGADNLVAIIDCEAPSGSGGLEPATTKFRALGWHAIEIDGHDLEAVLAGLEDIFEVRGKPSLVLAQTISGRGVPFMENVPHWQGSVLLPRREAEGALIALGCATKECARWLDADG